MTLSVFDLFKIGIGPSSSHTVGPMWAALRFVQMLEKSGVLRRVERIQVDLYGSLALTGRGHGTDRAVLLGLSGERPDTVDPEIVEPLTARVKLRKLLHLNGQRDMSFHENTDLLFHEDESLPRHPNGIHLSAFDAEGEQQACETYYSVGGGFIVNEREAAAGHTAANERPEIVPYDFHLAAELLAIGRHTGMSIADIVRANEAVWRTPAETDAELDRIWATMAACIERGCRGEGELPGGLHVRRRAGPVCRDLQSRQGTTDPMALLDWVSLFALAVNEENAAGGRVVTAPTNGAAGVIPAVLAYYRRFLPEADEQGVRTFLLTAGAIGMLYKRNASLSAAEMGCQGEVGVACSMAAAGTSRTGPSPSIPPSSPDRSSHRRAGPSAPQKRTPSPNSSRNPGMLRSPSGMPSSHKYLSCPRCRELVSAATPALLRASEDRTPLKPLQRASERNRPR